MQVPDKLQYDYFLLNRFHANSRLADAITTRDADIVVDGRRGIHDTIFRRPI